ncbi:MAG: molybdenum cofactor biosynthesis protein MoaB [Candidatus Lokiarchaeota archaeon]|nr:molybdenum cofactor biosynthesis protein MoaB [Candidatus Lokiarchaeota archaeon]
MKKDVHEQHKEKGPKMVRLALVVVSTSRFEEKQLGKESSDKTIPLVKDILEKHNDISLIQSKIIPDSNKYIKVILNKFLQESSINSIIFSGGTGLSKKDITYETIKPIFEKEISGFGEIFRYLSYQEIGAAAILSRATAGKIGDKMIFLLPGSPNAIKLALTEIIIPEIRHMIYIINKKE